MRKDKMLIVINPQNDYITGPLGTEEARSAVGFIQKKIASAREEDIPIIWVQDTHFFGYECTREGRTNPVPHCKYRSYGWEISKALAEDELELKICIYKTEIGYLRWREVFAQFEIPTDDLWTIEICGFRTETDILSNAIILRTAFPAVDIIIDKNACAGSTPKRHKRACKMLEQFAITIVGDE